ncbi:hypothetical protein C9I50_03265 [Pseudomonas prosekii]|nr:hypothetical protein C9I50_03265 [Pseudomonas prosekii]
MRIWVKLQNFVKAAILAIAQQNCSIDDAALGTLGADTAGASITRWRNGAHASVLQACNCEYLC